MAPAQFIIFTLLTSIMLVFINCGEGFDSLSLNMKGQKRYSSFTESHFTTFEYLALGKYSTKKIHYRLVGNEVVVDGDIHLGSLNSLNLNGVVAMNVALPGPLREAILEDAELPSELREVLDKYTHEVPIVTQFLESDNFTEAEKQSWQLFLQEELDAINAQWSEVGIKQQLVLKLENEVPFGVHKIELTPRRRAHFSELVKKTISAPNFIDRLEFALDLGENYKKALLRQIIMQSLGFRYSYLQERAHEHLIINKNNTSVLDALINTYTQQFATNDFDPFSVLQYQSFAWAKDLSNLSDKSKAVFLTRKDHKLIGVNSEFSELDLALMVEYFSEVEKVESSPPPQNDPVDIEPELSRVPAVTLRAAKKYSERAGEVTWENPISLSFVSVIVKWGLKGEELKNTIELKGKEKSFYSADLPAGQELELAIYVKSPEGELSEPAIAYLPKLQGPGQIVQAARAITEPTNGSLSEFKLEVQQNKNNITMKWGPLAGASYYSIYDHNNNFITSYVGKFQHKVENLLAGDYKFQLVAENDLHQAIGRLYTDSIHVQAEDTSSGEGLLSPNVVRLSESSEQVYFVIKNVAKASKYVFYYKPESYDNYLYGRVIEKNVSSLIFPKFKQENMQLYFLSIDASGKRSSNRVYHTVESSNQGIDFEVGGCNLGQIKLESQCVQNLKGLFVSEGGCRKTGEASSHYEAYWYISPTYLKHYMFNFNSPNCSTSHFSEVINTDYSVIHNGHRQNVGQQVTLKPAGLNKIRFSSDERHCEVNNWQSGVLKIITASSCFKELQQYNSLQLAEGGHLYLSAPILGESMSYPTILGKKGSSLSYKQTYLCPVKNGSGIMMDDGLCIAYACNFNFALQGRYCIKKQ